MMSCPLLHFTELSSDVDTYTISFKDQENNLTTGYLILNQAIHYRFNQIVTENELVVLSLSVKIDCFDFTARSEATVEMDTLYHTESVSSIDTYLYDCDNNLLAKGSGTLQYEKTSRIPAH